MSQFTNRIKSYISSFLPRNILPAHLYHGSQWQEQNRAVCVMPTNAFRDFFYQALEYATSSHLPDKSQHQASGSTHSLEKGQSTDYSESRPYTDGDDIRFINWKQSARKDELITNLYDAEKKQSHVVLLDCHSTMFFGTTVQPKIRVALKLATVKILQSITAGKPVTLLILQEGNAIQHSIENTHEALQLLTLVAGFNLSEHYPIHDNLVRHELSTSLRGFDNAQLCIISDFFYYPVNDIENLKKFRNHSTILIHVYDPLEMQFNTTIPLQLINPHSGSTVKITSKKRARNIWKQVENKNQLITEQLKSVSSAFYQLASNSDDKFLCEIFNGA